MVWQNLITEGVIIALITLVSTTLSGYLLYRKAKINWAKERDSLIKEKSHRFEVINKVLDLSVLSTIKQSVDYMLDHTKADRFLILIAINGKTDFNKVSVIYEQQEEKFGRTEAIAKYNSLDVDYTYRKFLKHAEIYKTKELVVADMDDCILKDIYEIEGVTHSNIYFLTRLSLDNNGNDMLVYTSVATHSGEEFNRHEKTIFKTEHSGRIKPSVIEIMKQYKNE